MVQRIAYHRSFGMMFFSLLLIGAIKCDKNFNPLGSPKVCPLPLNETVEIGYKETAKNSDENISLTFDALISDSRCPIGLRCVIAGYVEIAFIFNSVPFSLRCNQDTTIGHYNIRLVDVDPYPDIDSTYTKEDYAAEVIVTKIPL